MYTFFGVKKVDTGVGCWQGGGLGVAAGVPKWAGSMDSFLIN